MFVLKQKLLFEKTETFDSCFSWMSHCLSVILVMLILRVMVGQIREFKAAWAPANKCLPSKSV